MTPERPMTSMQPRAGGLEIRSIDYVPLSERHGKVWHLGPLWFMSNAQIATLAVGLVSVTALNMYGGSLTLISAVDSFRKVRPTLGLRVVTVGCTALLP